MHILVFNGNTHSCSTPSSTSATSSTSVMDTSKAATAAAPVFSSTSSALMGAGCGASAAPGYGDAIWFSCGTAAGWIGLGSEAQGDCLVAEPGDSNSPPPDILEYGRFLFESSPALLGRDRSPKSPDRSSWVRPPSDSNLFSMLWIRSASSLMYLAQVVSIS